MKMKWKEIKEMFPYTRRRDWKHRGRNIWIHKTADIDGSNTLGKITMLNDGRFMGADFYYKDIIIRGGKFRNCTINGGTFYDGEFLGGHFSNGKYYGGTFHGGLYRGGVFIGGEFFDGEYIGGGFYSGKYLGGVFIGGFFMGGRYHRGIYRTTPPLIVGLIEGHDITASGPDLVTIGNTTRSSRWWKKHWRDKFNRKGIPTDVGEKVIALLDTFTYPEVDEPYR